MARSIPSTPIPPAFVGHIFTSPSQRWGIFQRRSAKGWGIVKNNLVFQTLKVAYGSTPTCANICTIVSTCQREMTKRRMCMVCEKVAVLAVKKLFGLWPFALFQKPHCGAFVCLSWPHCGAFATILKTKHKCLGGGGWVHLSLIEP